MAIAKPDTSQKSVPLLSASGVTQDLQTTTTHPLKTTASKPVMQSRLVGLHAKIFGFNWEKRADQHRYLLQTGLPTLHAAIVNEDWQDANDLLCREALGQHWHPPAAQNTSKFTSATDSATHWTCALPSTNVEKRLLAIKDMVIERMGITNVGDSGSLLGTNLLTLCLLKPAPVEFLEQVIKLAKQYEPHLLSNPDAGGRTPLYIAVKRSDLGQIRLLQAAGANHFVCSHSLDPAGARLPTAFALARDEGSTEVFNSMLEYELSRWPEHVSYPTSKDPLGLAGWVQRHDEAEILALADRLPRLRLALFSYEDKTRTSLLCSAIRTNKNAINGESVSESILVDPGFDPFIRTQSQNSPIEEAAEYGTLATFVSMIRVIQQNWKDRNLVHALRHFLLSRSEADIYQLMQYCPDLSHTLIELACDQINMERKDMSADKFMTLVRLIWPMLDASGKSQVLAITACYTDQRMENVLAMLDCSLDDDQMEKMMENAARSGNTAAFEFAADRNIAFNATVSQLASSKYSFYPSQIEWVLDARSLRWLNKMVEAGFDLKKYVSFRKESVLPRLADLDPTGLAARLAGLCLQINANLAAKAKTDAGRKALLALIPTNSTSSNV